MEQTAEDNKGLTERAPVWRNLMYFSVLLTALIGGLQFVPTPENGMPVSDSSKLQQPIRIDSAPVVPSMLPDVNKTADDMLDTHRQNPPAPAAGSTIKHDPEVSTTNNGNADPALRQSSTAPDIRYSKKVPIARNENLPARIAEDIKSTNQSTSADNAARSDSLPGPAGILALVSNISEHARQDCQSLDRRVPTLSVTPGTTQVHLPDQGLWCFFAAGGVMYEVRMDAPFTGEVRGVRLGDNKSRVEELLGAPIRIVQPSAALPAMTFYQVGEKLLRPEYDASGAIKTMYLISSGPGH